MATKPKAAPKRKDPLDDPIPAGGMVRSGGKMVPRYARDTNPNEPIRNMKDKGSGLEVVPDKYAKGGTVRGMGAATKGGKFSRSC